MEHSMCTFILCNETTRNDKEETLEEQPYFGKSGQICSFFHMIPERGRFVWNHMVSSGYNTEEDEI